MCDVMPSIRLDGTAARAIQRSRRSIVTSSVRVWIGVSDRGTDGIGALAGLIAPASSPPVAVTGFG